MKSNGLSRELARIVGESGVLWRPEDLMLYEYDALSSLRQPDAVVFPRKTEHVVQIAKLALRHNLPLVARGAGTGLSGGSVATEGGILLVFLAHEANPGNRFGEPARAGAARSGEP